MCVSGCLLTLLDSLQELLGQLVSSHWGSNGRNVERLDGGINLHVRVGGDDLLSLLRLLLLLFLSFFGHCCIYVNVGGGVSDNGDHLEIFL